jgi:DNA-directed RNA polymerase subunit RPC12/RpoP
MQKIKCEKCGHKLKLNPEIEKHVCPYCGNSIVFLKPESEISIKDEKQTALRYKIMFAVNVLIGLSAFIAFFFFTDDEHVFLSMIIVLLLWLIPFRDSCRIMAKKDMLYRNGMQKGNIVGLLALIIIDIIMWTYLFIRQFKNLCGW